jgi:hypothetical protein
VYLVDKDFGPLFIKFCDGGDHGVALGGDIIRRLRSLGLNDERLPIPSE